MKELIIDANGLVVGRLAALCAKKALCGQNVEIYSIENAVISGNPKQVVGVYTKRRTMTNYANPEHASKWPRRPDYLFKKILSGMMPASRRGKQALARVKAYIGVNSKAAKVKSLKSSTKLNRGYISLGQICKELGGN